MSLEIILLVLLGALLHATWNAIVKAGDDKLIGAAMISAGGGLCCIPFLPFVPFPNIEALPYLLTSAVLQFAYFQLVAIAYRIGDIGLVYPLMRGVAPLIVAMTSGFILKEHLSATAILGITTISAGIMTLAFEARHGNRNAILAALANAAVIAAYTFVDGIGARLSGNAISYTLWMSLPPPVLLFAFAFYKRGKARVFSYVGRTWHRGLLGGAGGSFALRLAPQGKR